MALTSRPDNTGEHLLCEYASRCAISAHTFRSTTAGRMTCSARQLVASTLGSHKKGRTVGNCRAKYATKRAAAGKAGARSISRPGRAAGCRAARGSHGRRSRAHRDAREAQGRPSTSVECSTPKGCANGVGVHRGTAAQQMRQTRLMKSTSISRRKTRDMPNTGTSWSGLPSRAPFVQCRAALRPAKFGRL